MYLDVVLGILGTKNRAYENHWFPGKKGLFVHPYFCGGYVRPMIPECKKKTPSSVGCFVTLGFVAVSFTWMSRK